MDLSANSAAPRQAKWLAFAPTAAALGVFLLALGIVGVLIWSTRSVDALALDRQTKLVVQVLQQSSNQIAHEQESVTVWDDSVRQLRQPTLDLDWLDNNLGIWLHTARESWSRCLVTGGVLRQHKRGSDASALTWGVGEFTLAFSGKHDVQAHRLLPRSGEQCLEHEPPGVLQSHERAEEVPGLTLESGTAWCENDWLGPSGSKACENGPRRTCRDVRKRPFLRHGARNRESPL